MAGHRPSSAMPIPSSSSSHRLLSLVNPPNSKTSGGNPNDLDELDESDVVWSDLSSSSSSSSQSSVHIDNHLPRRFVHKDHHDDRRFGLSSLLIDSENKPIPTSSRPPAPESGHHHQSAPVPVPLWPKRKGWVEEVEEHEHEEEEEGVGMVPPHVMSARRSRAMTSFSVLEGAGRTLKGRDLRRVRNAVWRETGFLDL